MIFYFVGSVIFLPAAFTVLCLPCCGITSYVCKRRKNTAQSSLDRLVFHVAARIYWFLKKKKGANNCCYFVVLGKRAPMVYPYYLLVIASIIGFYTLYSLVVDSISIQIPFSFNNSSGNNSSDLAGCEPDEHCIEISFLSGLESALTIFSLCVFTFALTTYTLLKSTTWITKERSSSLKTSMYIIVFMAQTAGFVFPRVLYFLYLFKGGGFQSLIYGAINGKDQNTTHFDYNSLVAFFAILESVAMSMLTPWYWFKDDEETNYNIAQQEDSIPTHRQSPWHINGFEHNLTGHRHVQNVQQPVSRDERNEEEAVQNFSMQQLPVASLNTLPVASLNTHVSLMATTII